MSDLSPLPLLPAPLALLLLLAVLIPPSAAAQIISPGKLSQAHAQLEGIRNCTQCHQLREAGASAALCLDCHQPLAQRIRAGKGFHADLDRDCATCHKEHFGVDFALVRLDTAAFSHDRTGYLLEGAHREADCRACHTPRLITDPSVRAPESAHLALQRTFLGLPTECASCHAEEDPHASQFAGRACSQCHDNQSWERAAGFDHARSRYRLTGRHAAVDCAGCHASSPVTVAGQPIVRYRPLRTEACTSCHTDPHEGVMQGRCETCHSTAGWLQVDRAGVERRFNHRGTGFELVGSHAQLACASCHDVRASAVLQGIRIRYEPATAPRAYPTPVTGSCLSCHVDEHQGTFQNTPGGADCTACHGEMEWLPAHYGPERHTETSFPLRGAHVTVACADCHRTASDSLVFRVAAAACTDCHAPDDPHDGQFAARTCESCHSLETFSIADFDHATTRYPLDGAHRNVSCASCHSAEPGTARQPVVRYRPLGTRCVDCHGGGP